MLASNTSVASVVVVDEPAYFYVAERMDYLLRMRLRTRFVVARWCWLFGLGARIEHDFEPVLSQRW